MATNQVFQGYKGRAQWGATSSGSSAGSTTFNNVPGLRGLSVDVESEMADAASNDSSGWKEWLPTEKGWTVTASAVLLSTAGSTVQVDVREMLKADTRRWWIWFNTTGTGTRYIAGYAYVNTWGHQTDKTDVWLTNFSWTGDAKYVEA